MANTVNLEFFNINQGLRSLKALFLEGLIKRI